MSRKCPDETGALEEILAVWVMAQTVGRARSPQRKRRRGLRPARGKGLTLRLQGN